MGARYKILSLDGGGAWALIQVKALMAIYGEDANGHDVLKHFDFAVSNSGGSIVLAGLLKGLPLEKLLALFKEAELRRSIFSKRSFLRRFLFEWGQVGPRYLTRKKKEALRTILRMDDGVFGAGFGGDWIDAVANSVAKKTGKSAFSFVMLGFDWDEERAKFFRSNLHSQAGSFKSADGISLEHAVHASTNAPVNFFDLPARVPTETDHRNYWDGAVGGFNNPIVAGVVETLTNYREDPKDLCVLSIGTATSKRPVVRSGIGNPPYFVRRRDDPSSYTIADLVRDIKKMGTSIIADPPDAATFIAHIMLQDDIPLQSNEIVQNTRIVRMNPMIQPKAAELPGGGHEWQADDWFDTPDKGLAKRLYKLDMDAVEDDQVKDIEHLADLWLDDKVQNQPIRAGKDLKAEIGQDTFSAAKAQWGSL